MSAIKKILDGILVDRSDMAGSIEDIRRPAQNSPT